ncbi:uncharacterized protein METZ01_LOCUS207497, partial [marine metagenome]
VPQSLGDLHGGLHYVRRQAYELFPGQLDVRSADNDRDGDSGASPGSNDASSCFYTGP